MTRILVTGATGFIGREARPLLLAGGHEVIAVSTSVPIDLPAGVECLQANLTDPASVTDMVQKAGASHLLHLAWHRAAGGLWNAPENMDWLQATLQLGRAFLDAGGTRIVLCGSCGEYDWTGGTCREDETPLTPSTYYGACKLAAETALAHLCRINDKSFACGRPFFIYGPGEAPARLGASVILSLLKGEEALCSHGKQLRDYMHVRDVAGGLVALLTSQHEGNFNIASGEAIQVKNLINAMATEIGRPELVKLGARDAPAHEPELIVADMTKTRDALNWQPQYDLVSGVADTVEWFRKNADLA